MGRDLDGDNLQKFGTFPKIWQIVKFLGEAAKITIVGKGGWWPAKCLHIRESGEFAKFWGEGGNSPKPRLKTLAKKSDFPYA